MKARLHMLVVASTALLAAPQASAATAVFSLTPVPDGPVMPRSTSYFVLDSTAGKTIVRQARLKNVGGTTGTVRIYPVDAVTGRTSGAVYRARRAPRADVEAWIALRPRTVRLGPGESRLIRFVVHVPRGARAGDHLGAIVAEKTRLVGSRFAEAGGVRLRIRVRTLSIAAVLVRLPGGSCRLSIGGVHPGGGHGLQYLYVDVRNPGERLTKGSGALVVRTAAGRPVARRAFRLDTFVPRTAIGLPVRLRSILAPGRYRATIAITACASAGSLGTARAWVLGPSATARSVSGRVTRTVTFSVSKSQHSNVLAEALPVSTPRATVARTSPSGHGGGGIGTAVTQVLKPVAAGAGAAALVATLIGVPAVVIVMRRRRFPAIGDGDDRPE
jgi:hypothetical protein